MPATVRIQDILDAMEMQPEEYGVYLDRETGRVEAVADNLLQDAESAAEGDEPPKMPEWQRSEWETATKVVSTNRMIRVPDKFEIHEWEIMQRFSNSVESDEVRRDLMDAIHGAGAFRNFKRVIRLRDIENSWYAFRDEALRKIAITWCEEHGIPFE